MVDWIIGGIAYAVAAYLTYMFLAYGRRSDSWDKTLAPLLGPLFPVYYIAFVIMLALGIILIAHGEFRRSIRGY